MIVVDIYGGEVPYVLANLEDLRDFRSSAEERAAYLFISNFGDILDNLDWILKTGTL